MLTILKPGIARVPGFVRSLLAFEREGSTGTLPRWLLFNYETWTMIGYPAVPVIADAALKGLVNGSGGGVSSGGDAAAAADIDLKEIFAVLRSTAEGHINDAEQQEQSGLAYVNALSFIPALRHEGDGAEVGADRLIQESVSKALEYASADWCIAQVAKTLGNGFESDYRYFSQRADLWKLYLDPETNFMRPRTQGGAFLSSFDPAVATGRDFTESDAWQYSFHVLHDVPGLVEAMGGSLAFERQLNLLFTPVAAPRSNMGQADMDTVDEVGLIGGYAHGNEPGHHVPYLYNFISKPWKTQEIVHQILTELYWAAPDGLAGNDDYGAMSAWYVFSSLGFYPVNPCSGRYQLGRPMVTGAMIPLDGGLEFRIEVRNQALENKYVQEARLNGRVLERTYIDHAEIVAGGVLEFVMGPEVNQEALGASLGASL